MTKENGLFFVVLVLSLIIGISGIVLAGDVQIECAQGSIPGSLVSDNFTFNISDNFTGFPVTREYYFISSGTTPTSVADNFTWHFTSENSEIAPVDNVTKSPFNYSAYNFRAPGAYFVSVIASNGGNVCSDTYGHTINATMPVRGYPFNYSPYNWEMRFGYALNTTSSIPDKVNGLVWKFNDSTSESWTYPSAGNHTFPRSSPYYPQSYTYNVTASNKTSDLIFPPNLSGTYSFTMYPPPVSDFFIYRNTTQTQITKISTPARVDFFNNSSSFTSLPFTYEWNLADGSPLNVSDNITNYTYSPGIYNITLKTFSAYGWNLTNKTLMVYDNMTANLTAVPYNCAAFPVNITFRDNSTGSQADKWTWTFGDGTQAINLTTNWTNHTYYQPKIYDVTLHTFNSTFGISNTSPIQHVNVTGVYANFTYEPVDPTIFRNSPTVFNFTSTSEGLASNANYFWQFEPNRFSYAIKPNYTFSRNGTYNISLTVTNPTCGASNTTTRAVTVYEHVESGISWTPSCGSFPLSVQFSDNSTDNPNLFWWTFYDSNGQNPIDNNTRNPLRSYPGPGSYKVEYRSGNNNEWGAKQTYYVSLSDCIQANFTANLTKGYYPLSVNFTDTSLPIGSVSSRTWNFGDQETSTLQSVIHTFRQKGNFNVSLTTTNVTSGLTKVANKTIEVGSPVFANFTPNSSGPVWVNTTKVALFTDLSAPQSEITNWNWNFDDALVNETNKSPSHLFTTEGFHNVTLTVSNPYYGATSTFRQLINVSVQKAPIASFTIDPAEANRYDWVNFIDTSTGPERDTWKWAWTFGDGNASVEQSPRHQYSNAGQYPVNLTVTNAYGSTTASNTARIRGPVFAEFTTESPGWWGVVGQPVTFIDTSLGQPVTWDWDFGDGKKESTVLPRITHTYNATSYYTINMTVRNWYGSTDSKPHQLQVEEKSRPRDVNFEVPGLNYSGNRPYTVQFNDTTPSQSNVTSWFWEFGDQTNSFERNPSHTYNMTGEFSVTLTVKNENGVNEKTRVAYVVVV
ncbi:MAG TPA: PKD domain-containing protein [Methanospirillum sp.]|nr:PKD domain-containing protein [Methanospirillum sp.]